MSSLGVRKRETTPTLTGKSAHPLAEAFEMLHGENGGGDEDGDLFFSIDDRFKGGAHRHFGFAVADVAADEPVHRLWRNHVLFDRADGAELVFGFDEGKILLELAHEGAVGWVGEAAVNCPLGAEAEEIFGVADDRALRVRRLVLFHRLPPKVLRA